MRTLSSAIHWLEGPGFIAMQFVLFAILGAGFVLAWAGAA